MHKDIVHVGGRCANAEKPDEAVYPQIVPHKSELARLVNLDAHLKTLHGGTIQSIAEIRTQFWIPACGNQLQKVILNCITCCIFSSSSKELLIGDLPKSRITVPYKALQHVGLEFVCFATKAMHLEIICDLTTQPCIANLRRLISRKGSLLRLTQITARIFKAPLQSSLNPRKFLMTRPKTPYNQYQPDERPISGDCGKLEIRVQKKTSKKNNGQKCQQF